MSYQGPPRPDPHTQQPLMGSMTGGDATGHFGLVRNYSLGGLGLPGWLAQAVEGAVRLRRPFSAGMCGILCGFGTAGAHLVVVEHEQPDR